MHRQEWQHRVSPKKYTVGLLVMVFYLCQAHLKAQQTDFFEDLNQIKTNENQ